MDIARLALEERADLGEFLACLSPEQWDAQPPCGRYRVRDVVDDLLDGDRPGIRALLGRLLTERPCPERDRTNGHRWHAPDEAVALLTEKRRAAGPLASLSVRVALAECLIHHQLIRRSLAVPRHVPAERLVPVLDHVLAIPLARTFRRAHGLRLVATDVDWSAGRGPLVIGQGEPLLMALSGCREAADDLSGDGRKILDTRLTS